jgi:hypothetical protein
LRWWWGQRKLDRAGQAPAQPSGSGSLTIYTSDYAFTPKDGTTNAGMVTISAPNQGQLPHELVLFKTRQSPGSLPTLSNGEVDEEGLEASGVESPGEIEDVSPGETKSAALKNLDDLKPDQATVQAAIKEGPGGMPANLLTAAQA